MGLLLNPDRHLGGHLEDVTPEEMQRRFTAMLTKIKLYRERHALYAYRKR